MSKNNDELNAFKSQINLVEYAVSQGFSVDKKRSSRLSTYMVNRGTGERIVVATSQQNHGIYFTVGSDTDSGTIIDFVQNKKGLSLGLVRKELRPWAGITAPTNTVKSTKEAIKSNAHIYNKPEPSAPTEQRKERIRAEISTLKKYTGGYLESRGISPETIAHFSKQIAVDERKNTCFLHRDLKGIVTGWEKKNNGFTGFSSGGEKAFFMQRASPNHTIKNLILFESAIDAMSFHQLYDAPDAMYIAIGGSPNENQINDILNIAKSKGYNIFFAFDNDESGQNLTHKIHEKALNLDIETGVYTPTKKDWNDDLQTPNSGEHQYDRER